MISSFLFKSLFFDYHESTVLLVQSSVGKDCRNDDDDDDEPTCPVASSSRQICSNTVEQQTEQHLDERRPVCLALS